MFLKVEPIGTNILDDEDRMPIWKVVSGDDWLLTIKLTVPGQPRTPATPDNSKVTFVVAEDRFSTTPIYTAHWDDGVNCADKTHGLVSIRIPDAITQTLRRGAYAFSVTVSDQFNRNKATVIKGTIQVEYEPTSPQHNIPYRRDR
jgi:hypothetical protein